MRLPRKGSSLQAKLIISFLAVVGLTSLGALYFGGYLIDRYIIQQAHENVAKSVETFSDLYANKLYVKHRLLNTLASFSAFREDLRAQRRQKIAEALGDLQREGRFDLLNVTDASGKVLVRAANPAVRGDSVRADPYVSQVIQTGKPCFGFDVMDPASLSKEGRELAERAVVPIVPTRKARETERKTEARGLFLKAASPVLRDGRLVGVIYGGVLLNHDVELPDRAKRLVFGDEQVNGRDIGAATLFLGDVRVSTNVRTQSGARAVGTLVSQEVFQQVYEDGKTWRGKAFVVDRWYLAAYKPVTDLSGKTVGILYTGILEEKYDRIRNRASLFLLLLTGLSGVVAALLASSLVHHFISPIRALEAAAERIIGGEYAKVDIRAEDEMGTLGFVFNKMVDSLIEKDRKLREHVEKQILHTEKLASLGRLSSGIAHEINNPLTGILAYSGSLLEELQGTRHEEDLRVIREETLRCREIVKSILDFARESKLQLVRANLNPIIESVLPLLEKHERFQNVRIARELDPALPDCLVDVNQMKSVLHNLASNAADAMPGGGVLTIRTEARPEAGMVALRVSDTGVGIRQEDLGQVLDPFFTTKDTGKGTGLGLSITYGIIKRHNGTIDIASQVGAGTTVEVHLPAILPEEAV